MFGTCVSTGTPATMTVPVRYSVVAVPRSWNRSLTNRPNVPVLASNDETLGSFHSWFEVDFHEPTLVHIGPELNVLSVDHHRAGLDLAVDEVEVLLTLETRDPAHRDEVVSGLRAQGYRVDLVR